MFGEHMNKIKVLIIHGLGGNSRENWFPWLKRKLELEKIEVVIPNLPDSDNPKQEEWLNVVEEFVDFDKKMILIGHSLGSVTILRFLERTNRRIEAAILVAGACRPIGIKETENFLEGGFNWKKIKRNARIFVVYHSDNDPYIPLEQGVEIAQKLGVRLNFIKGAGHFNKASGFTEFDHLLKTVKNIVKKI